MLRNLKLSLALAALLPATGWGAGIAVTGVTFTGGGADRAELTGLSVGGSPVGSFEAVILPTTPTIAGGGSVSRQFTVPANELGSITTPLEALEGLGLNSGVHRINPLLVKLPVPITSANSGSTGVFAFQRSAGDQDVVVSFYGADGTTQLGASLTLDSPLASLGSEDVSLPPTFWNNGDAATLETYSTSAAAFYVPTTVTDVGAVHFMAFSDSDTSWSPSVIGQFGFDPTVIPEPSRVALLALGLISAIRVRRRPRNK